MSCKSGVCNCGHIQGLRIKDTSCVTHHNTLDASNQTGGIKHDQGKPPMALISHVLMEEIAAVRAFGAQKYSEHNWRNGFKVTRSMSSALRHIFAFLSGQDKDEESGQSHLAHAVCCLEHAMWDMRYHPNNDDRYKGENK